MAETRELRVFDRLGEGTKVALKNAGYVYANTVAEMYPIDLALELELSDDELTEEIVQTVRLKRSLVEGRSRDSWLTCEPDGSASMWEILVAEKRRHPIKTLIPMLDKMIGKYIPYGTITELSGLPGSGKTQLATQICFSATQLASLLGSEGEVVYIDTEGSLVASRIKEQGELFIAMCNKELEQKKLPLLSIHEVLSKIHVFRTTGLEELLSLLEGMSEWLSHHPKVILIVLDSLTAPLRTQIKSDSKKGKSCFRITEILVGLCMACHLAVVVTNQLTTQIHPIKLLKPALGDLWQHNPGLRMSLVKSTGFRLAKLLKGLRTPEGQMIPFVINKDGLKTYKPFTQTSCPTRK